tara:strand:+ start:130 stop:918 length:789 start_codon:yes stop_codon:yes gene_type:complete
MLAQKNPFRGDSDISFDEPSHTYTVRGKKVPISVTKLGTQAVPPEHRFDKRKVIAKNLTSWRNNASSKYHAMVANVDDEQATKNVLSTWDSNRDAGTGMHKCFEQIMNLEPVPRADEYAEEIVQFHVVMDRLIGFVPARTEMSVFANDDQGDAAVAGQIDLLMKDGEGHFHIVDFKRTAGDLSPGAFAFGKTFLNNLPLNDHYKYSLQLAMYALMFELQTGVPVASMRLLQVHPDLDEPRLIPTSDMKEHARALLEGAGVAF